MVKSKYFIIFALLWNCILQKPDNPFDPNGFANLAVFIANTNQQIVLDFSSSRVQPGESLFVTSTADLSSLPGGLVLPIADGMESPIESLIPRSRFMYEVKMNPRFNSGNFTINLHQYYSSYDMNVLPSKFNFSIDSNPPQIELKLGSGIDISELATGFLDFTADEDILWNPSIENVRLAGSAKNSLVISGIVVSERNIRLILAGSPNFNGGILSVEFLGIEDKANNRVESLIVPIHVFAFRSGPNMNVARRLCAGIDLADGRRMVTGGRSNPSVPIDGNTSLSLVEFYNPLTRSFELGGNMLYRRQDHSIVRLLDGRILVTGGFGAPRFADGAENEVVNSIEIFDPITNLWTLGPNLHRARQLHKTIVLPNGDVLVVGGFNAFSPVVTIAEVELIHITNDVASMTVEHVGNLVVPRGKNSLSIVGNKVVIAGGERTVEAVPKNLFYPTDIIELYDITTKSLSVSTSKVIPRLNHFSHVLPNDEVLFFGGISNRYDGHGILRAQIYNLNTDTIRNDSNLFYARELGSSFVFPYGKNQLILFGGLEYRETLGALFESVTRSESWSDNDKRFYLTSDTLTTRWEGCTIQYQTGGGMVLGGRIGSILANTEEYSFE
ncbi:kelch-like protein [Leptospira sp. 96542]|nr:kelch-like protein [Leptospira sp. 96542]